MHDERPEPDAERRLLDRFRGGDATAFDEIVLLHRRGVYRIARRITGSHEEADEVAQETFVRAWKALGRFRGDARLSTWLARIAINLGRETVSSRKPRGEIEGTERFPDPAEGAEAGMLRAAARARVRAAVAALPPRQREVVALKVFLEMTYDEVAATMGLTAGAVKAHLHQAVANLRRRL